MRGFFGLDSFFREALDKRPAIRLLSSGRCGSCPQFMERVPPDFVAMREAVGRLGASRQTAMQRATHGKLDAVSIRAGKKKALRIKVADDQPTSVRAA